MMKKIFLTITIGFCVLSQPLTHAQEQGSLRERLARKQAQQEGKTTASQNLTVRSQLMNESQTQDISNSTWMREIYRFLDLQKEKNAALYYPVKPVGDRTNLFTMIFKQVLAGNIDVYAYQLDGSERFSDEYKMKIDDDFFLKFDIPFELKDGKYYVDQASVPSEEIKGYYLKETWYFDKNNSVVDIKTIAVCPVMMYQENDGAGLSRFPLFWIPYESIRPYATKMPMMVSSLNNASTQTINDFFVKHNFEGEIYKTTNMMNRTLAEQFEGDSLKKEQKKIELQLKQFNDNLWVYNDSIGINERKMVATKASKKTSKSNVESNTKSAAVPADDTNRATIQKEAKQQKASPARSMRNRKRN
ncbi:MAG: gliding motility protein GldN [Bacteroidota bacterium]|jgi:gliding motility associated protien GldN